MNYARYHHPKFWFLLSYSHCLNFSWNMWFPQNYGLSEVTIYTLADNLVSSLYWEHSSKSLKVLFLHRRTSKVISSLKYMPMSEKDPLWTPPLYRSWPFWSQHLKTTSEVWVCLQNHSVNCYQLLRVFSSQDLISGLPEVWVVLQNHSVNCSQPLWLFHSEDFYSELPGSSQQLS